MSGSKKKVLAICGSTRKNSSNEAILKGLAISYGEHLELQLYTDLAELPHFNPDIEDASLAQSVKDFREMIEKADGVIICTPEYVFSLPGSLKNAIEWTVSTTVFLNKPTALIVASGMGEKAYESLVLIMNTVGSKIGEHATILIKGARSKFNDQGVPTDSQTKKDLEKMMNSLLQTINTHSS
jgi:chromate reductase, NAD(P)H dehydrogenase (quinone)